MEGAIIKTSHTKGNATKRSIFNTSIPETILAKNTWLMKKKKKNSGI